MSKRDDDVALEATERLRQARPEADGLALEAARARAERALFRTGEPARIGRFELRGTLGGGGMGVVHRAHDPQLDREVALKIIRSDGVDDRHAHERLLAEARALARLRHPNVVPVHDVLVVDGQVVMVMELIEGQTVAGWAEARPRTWREIVAVYVAAGRGLAAAHALGLVHRDVKPTNILVGDDGRVRVVDFGLAGVAPPADDGERARPPALSPVTLTATGTIVGTPAYMAPEQLGGGPPSPAADQFSFCASLHQTLFGVRPFAGDSVAELRAAIDAGRLAAPAAARRVPARLRALVVRGLAAAPAARHPSMRALVDRLDREHGWRRWRNAAVVTGATAAIAVTALVGARGRAADTGDRCTGGVEEIAGAWNDGRRARVATTLRAIGTPYAAAIVEGVTGGLDEYRDAWTRAHRTACVSHRLGARSASQLDRGMSCLERRRDALASAADLLEHADGGAVVHARELVAALPPIAWCLDGDVLAAAAEPPAEPTVRTRVAQLRGELAAVENLERLGRSAEALAASAPLVRASEQLGYQPALVEALLVHGRILIAREAYGDAITTLARAQEVALELKLETEAVIAGARRLYAEAMSGGDRVVLASELHFLEPLSRKLPGEPFARPLLLNNIGVLHMSRREPEQARAMFSAARAAIADVPEPDLELIGIDGNLAMVTPEPSTREALVRSAWTRLRARLGAQHVTTLVEQRKYAHFVDDPARAIPLVREACALYREFHPELRYALVDCLSYLAFLSAELGGDASDVYRQVVAAAAGSGEEDVVARGALAAGYLATQAGEIAAARQQFADVLATTAGRLDDRWYERRAAHAALGLGLLEVSAGRDRIAIPNLERAEATFARLTAIGQDAENRQRLALTRVALASALRRLGDHTDRPAALAEAAAAYYRTVAPSTYEARLASLADLTRDDRGGARSR